MNPLPLHILNYYQSNFSLLSTAQSVRYCQESYCASEKGMWIPNGRTSDYWENPRSKSMQSFLSWCQYVTLILRTKPKV